MREEDRPREYRVETAGAKVCVTTFTCRTCSSQMIVQKDNREYVFRKDKEGKLIARSKW